jgi:membrane protein
MHVKRWWTVITQTGISWSEDNATRLAASLAFYTVLSIAPLLVIAVVSAGWFFGDEAARGQVAAQLTAIVGPEAGEGIQALLQHASEPRGSVLSSVIGVAVLLFGASGVFGELQAALNTYRAGPKVNVSSCSRQGSP